MIFVKFNPEFGHVLKFWLAHDSWHVSDALALLACINPKSEGLRRTNKSLEPAFSEWFDFDDAVARDEYEKLWSIWRSGIYIGRHHEDEEWLPPAYFIKWAIEKRLEVPWLEWAIANGLIDENINEQTPEIPVQAQTDDVPCIQGPTFSKLQRAVSAFPEKYPKYRTHAPKLDEDVRPWLRDVYKANAAEQRVFGAILREHFKLSADTSENQS